MIYDTRPTKRGGAGKHFGRSCNRIRPGYRRIEHGKHVILYRADRDGIFISRVLHQRMLPSEHWIDDE